MDKIKLIELANRRGETRSALVFDDSWVELIRLAGRLADETGVIWNQPNVIAWLLERERERSE